MSCCTQQNLMKKIKLRKIMHSQDKSSSRQKLKTLKVNSKKELKQFRITNWGFYNSEMALS